MLILNTDAVACMDDDQLNELIRVAIYEREAREMEASRVVLSNCCGYLRYSSASRSGIKSGRLEAYANFFLYRWSHIRKGGLMHATDCMMTRLASTPKRHLFDDYGGKDEIWS